MTQAGVVFTIGITAIVGLVVEVVRRSLSGPRSLVDLQTGSYDLQRLKELTQILVIDDDPRAFPVSLLQQEGYRITYWPAVQNLTQIEGGSFDIIVLDIAGVAKQWSEQDADGLAILRLIKRTNPGQYVISFSGQKAVHELGEFWKLSDDQLKKPVAAEDCKAAIDSAMRNRVNVSHYWSRISELLRSKGVGESSISSIERQLVNQARKGDRTDGPVRATLTALISDKQVSELLVTLSTKLLTAAVAK